MVVLESMDITIDGPIFYSQEDENIFFLCIYNLQDYKQVVGHGMELTISFNKNPSELAISQLLVICKRWDINPAPLNILINKSLR